MMDRRKKVFTGVCTATVTPFRDGEVDFRAFGRLIDRQLAGGIDAICVAGTTGEAPTLTHAEWRRLLLFAVDRIGGRVPVIAGAGSNSTEKAVVLTGEAKEIGVDAVLSVTPYYNKGTADGIVCHYHKIAEVGLPVIAYNVPSRTGVDLTPGLYRRIAEHPNIAGVKEAGGGYDRLTAYFAALGDSLPLYTGNDGGLIPATALGASGVVSVVSNLLPNETEEIWHLIASGKIREASTLQRRQLPLISALFDEPNPAPVKRGMELLGLCAGELRLPLTAVSGDLSARLAYLLGAGADST